MSIENKVDVCMYRLQNMSLRETAKEANITYQYVSVILEVVKKEAPKNIKSHKPELSNEQCREIFRMCFEGFTKDEISEALSIDIKEINNLYVYVTKRKSKKIESAFFPKLAKWANENDYGLRALGKAVGKDPQYISEMFRGYASRPMTRTLARRFSRLTGLTERDIFEELFRRHAEQMKKARAESEEL